MAQRHHRAAVILTTGAALLLMTACGGSSSSSESSSAASAAPAASSAAASAAASAAPAASSAAATAGAADGLAGFESTIAEEVTAALAPQTSHVPTEGPKGKKDVSVVIVPPAGATTEGGYRTSKAAVDAANSLGWKVTYINPEGDVNKMNEAIQKAIAIGADGIITVSIDGSLTLSALQQAKDAGIKLVGVAAANSEGETGIYDVMVPDVASGEQNGYLLGQAAYNMMGKKVQSIDMAVKGFGYVDARQRGWEKFMADCEAAGGDCKILATTDFAAADIGTKLPQMTAATARSNPDFNVLWGGFDSGITFMEQGLQQGGLDGSSNAFGFDGNNANLDQIRNDGYEKATVGLSTMCLGYAAVDNLNRLLSDTEPLVGAEQGCANKLLTKENVPASGPWWGDVDVRPDYWKLWGVPTPATPAPAEEL